MERGRRTLREAPRGEWGGTGIESGSRGEILGGYLLGAGPMVVAALVEPKLGIAAERRPLEDAPRPLSSHPGAEVV